MGTHAWLLGALVLAFTLIGLALRHHVLLLLALPLATFWLIGLYRSVGQMRPRLEVKRTLSENRVLSGDRITVEVEIAHDGPFVDQLELHDDLPDGLEFIEGNSSWMGIGKPGETFFLCYQVRVPRGYYRWNKVNVTARHHLASDSVSVSLPCQSTLWSLPKTESARSLFMVPRRTRVFSGFVKARRGGEGLEFFDTRAYVAGDEIRRIHWKATARTGQWVTTQFEQERIADVGIVLDARFKSDVDYTHLGPPYTHSLFEQGIRAAASIAEVALSQGNRVGLLNYGRGLEWTYPGYGNRQRERILQALTKATLGNKAVLEDLDYLPKRLFPLRSQIMLVSPLLANDVEVLKRLQAHDYYITVISPNPVLFEARLIEPSATSEAAVRLAQLERRSRLQALRRGGVIVIDWDTAQPLYPQLLQALAWVRR